MDMLYGCARMHRLFAPCVSDSILVCAANAYELKLDDHTITL